MTPNISGEGSPQPRAITPTMRPHPAVAIWAHEPSPAKAGSARIAALQSGGSGNHLPIPVDLVTASGSGLDPEISIAAARYQAARVARLRGLPLDQVQSLIDQYTAGRHLRFFGEPRVNVLQLNLALDARRIGMMSDRKAPDPDELLAASRGKSTSRRAANSRFSLAMLPAWARPTPCSKPPTSAVRGRRCGRRLCRNPRAQRNRSAGQWPGDDSPPAGGVPRDDPAEMDLDAVLARRPAAGAGRRAGPHQRAGTRAIPSATRTSRRCWLPGSMSIPPSTSSTWKASTTSSPRSPASRSARRAGPGDRQADRN